MTSIEKSIEEQAAFLIYSVTYVIVMSRTRMTETVWTLRA